MAKVSDFYGNSGAVKSSAGAPMALPAQMAGIGTKPVMFWGVMVALLIVTRFLYESAA